MRSESCSLWISDAVRICSASVRACFTAGSVCRREGSMAGRAVSGFSRCSKRRRAVQRGGSVSPDWFRTVGSKMVRAASSRGG